MASSTATSTTSRRRLCATPLDEARLLPGVVLLQAVVAVAPLQGTIQPLVEREPAQRPRDPVAEGLALPDLTSMTTTCSECDETAVPLPHLMALADYQRRMISDDKPHPGPVMTTTTE